MDIEKLIQELGKSIGKIICNRKEESSKKINIEKMSSIDIFKILFIKSVHERNYNKAEDLIFDELEENNSPEIYEIAGEFYNSLLKKSEEFLKQIIFQEKKFTRD